MKYFVLAVLAAVSVAAQQQPVVHQPVYVTAIELVADVRDAKGEVPSDLKPADFVVLEDGVEQAVIGVDYFSTLQPAAAADPQAKALPGANRQGTAGWQIVIFFDMYLSSAATIKSSVDSLVERADELARLGQVSIVTADPEIDFKVLGARSPEQIRQALRTVKATSARNWLVRHRRQYQHRSDQARGGRLVTTDLSVFAQNREMEEFLRSEILAEVDAVERFQASLLTAIGRFPRRTPRALFVVSEGFELDSSAFYQQFATDIEDITRIRATPLEFNVGDTVDSIARVLAASGWTTIGVSAPLGSGEQWLDDASRSMIGRPSQPRAQEALYASERGNDPLIAFAVETGGSAGTPGMIGKTVARLQQALIISYQVSRQPDGKPRSIQIKSRRPGLDIKAFKWATESTPSELAATRTLSLLSDSTMSGDLPTTVSLDWTGRIGPRRDGMITVNSSLAAVGSVLADRQTVFRVTIVVGRKNMPPTIVHRTVTPRELSDTFSLRVPIEAGDEQLDVAATVEELSSGLWGGQRVGG
ncbi:MAG TPA: hypothetical protein VF432_28940 [Thermoanaerobaculia bacterium]